MAKYKVSVSETLERLIEIEADSDNEALDAAIMLYKDEKIVLDSADYVDTSFDVIYE